MLQKMIKREFDDFKSITVKINQMDERMDYLSQRQENTDQEVQSLKDWRAKTDEDRENEKLENRDRFKEFGKEINDLREQLNNTCILKLVKYVGIVSVLCFILTLLYNIIKLSSNE